MSRNPIQVVLNSSNYINVWDRPPGGSKKDFYEGNDIEFVEHKQNLKKQLSTISERKYNTDFSDIRYVKVKLKTSALAKSHRPSATLFTKDIAPVVGNGDLGEMLVEFNANSVEKLNSKINRAEEETKWKLDKKNKMIANPSKERSAIGAIEEIVEYHAADKRNFTVKDGLEWLKNPRTGGSYIIELFDIPSSSTSLGEYSEQKLKLFNSFIQGLNSQGNGLVATSIERNESSLGLKLMGVRLENSSNPPKISFLELRNSVGNSENIVNELNVNLEQHVKLIKFLDEHPLVKKIFLPPIINKSNPIKGGMNLDYKDFEIPKKNKDLVYPKIAVVDGGVSKIFGDWIVDSSDFLDESDKDVEHATFISGLWVFGQLLNGKEVCNEIDGCEIIDLDLLPKDAAFESYYGSNSLQFFTQLGEEIKAIKNRTGVRIFNFSLNFDEHVSSNGYSLAARYLDEIAIQNDVIFVISAGNTEPFDCRQEWPDSPVDALNILAVSKNDIIRTPSESCRNLCISSLNPPKLDKIIPHTLANYSCRGPGTRVGLKPDLAHIGGAGSQNTGLLSINSDRKLIYDCGTSFSAPQVAKILARLENEIHGDLSRESLISMLIHNSVLPDVLAIKDFSGVSKHLVGFGIPKRTDEIIEGGENEITLLFSNTISSGKKLSFSFTWPESLVDNGKCFGYAKLTLVYMPPFNYNFGAEFVRVNLDGYLRQKQKNGKYLGRLEPVYLPDGQKEKLSFEKGQIEHLFKWSPTKVYEKTMKGVGPSKEWKLEIESLLRDGEVFPQNGIPFTAILTISDPKGEKPVFNEMRQSLQSLGVTIQDVKTAARVSSRI